MNSCLGPSEPIWKLFSHFLPACRIWVTCNQFMGIAVSRFGLRNLKRTKTVQLGEITWKLETNLGIPIPAFSIFCERYLGHPISTRKRYAEATSRFIDYLYEVGVFDGPVSSARLNAVINAYPILLVNGSKSVAIRAREYQTDLWLADAAEKLDWDPLKPNSLSNALAPVNKFLRLSESIAREAHERATILGYALSNGPVQYIQALDGFDTLGGTEVAALKQNSMFGNVAKFAPNGIRRARNISARGARGRSPRHNRDFPRELLSALIQAAKTWRDKVLWLCLAALGIRTSEALNILLEDIDLEAQKIYILDPKGRHAQVSLDNQQRLRFKGREVVDTYPIPELKADLFFAIEKYLELEYVPCHSPGEPAYFFQYVEATKVGQPFVDVSAEALRQNFLDACKAAAIPAPPGRKNWVLHSLRHMYAVYQLNDFPVDASKGIFGFTLVEVQLMLGHKNIQSTAVYARAKHRRIDASLKSHEEKLQLMSEDEVRALPRFGVRLTEKK